MRNIRIATRRLTGAALLLAVFLLPLHLHFYSAASVVNKDCTCYSGARIQLGPAQAVEEGAPVYEVFSVNVVLPRLIGRTTFQPRHSRAPPLL